MTPIHTVVVLAKTPVPGRVKTRLCPPLSHDQAADVAAAALDDTLDVVLAVPGARRVLALDGEAGRWIPPGFDIVAQPPGGLDERIAAAFGAASGPTVLIGMDTPQVEASDIERALAELDRGADAVVGPACDGGYWLLGLRAADPNTVLGVPMSNEHTGTAQLARLRALGLTTSLLRELRDVDEYADALAVAAVAPSSRFAQTLHSLEPAVATGARR